MRVLVPRLRLAFRRLTWSAHALRQKASVSGKMAAKTFASRFRGSRRFLSGFVAGAVAGAMGTGLTVVQFLRSRDAEPALAVREPDGECGSPGLGPGLLPRAGAVTMDVRCLHSPGPWSSALQSPGSASSPRVASHLPAPCTSFPLGIYYPDMSVFIVYVLP